MLLLFWKNRAPSYAVAALSARPSATLTGSRERVGTVQASARASSTTSAVHSEVNTLASVHVSTGVRLATTGSRGALENQAVLVAGSRTASASTGAHSSPQQELVTRAWASSLTSRAALVNTAAVRAHGELLPGVVRAGHRGAALVRADLRVVLIGERYILPRIPMQQLTPINLGTGYRGDTMILPIWEARTREGEPYDLEDGILHFTAKEDLALPDVAPHVIQCSTEDGGITILDPPELGRYRVRIEWNETQDLLGDTVFTFDVQLHTDSANIYTIRRGLLTVVRDVTRAPA